MALGKDATVLGATKVEVATELDLINSEESDGVSFCGGKISWAKAGMGSH